MKCDAEIVIPTMPQQYTYEVMKRKQWYLRRSRTQQNIDCISTNK